MNLTRSIQFFSRQIMSICSWRSLAASLGFPTQAASDPDSQFHFCWCRCTSLLTLRGYCEKVTWFASTWQFISSVFSHTHVKTFVTEFFFSLDFEFGYLSQGELILFKFTRQSIFLGTFHTNFKFYCTKILKIEWDRENFIRNLLSLKQIINQIHAKFA